MMRRAVHTLLLLLPVLSGILLASCCPEDPFIPTRVPGTTDSANQAYLRFIVVDPDIAPVRAMLDDVPIFCQPLGSFEFPEEVYEAQYWPVDTAATELSFTFANGTTVAMETVDLRKGSYQTAFLYASGSGHDILMTTDDPQNVPGNAEIRYRLVNFAQGAPNVDIIFEKNPSPGETQVVNNLGYGDTTAFLVQSTGTLPDGKSLTVVDAQTGDTIIRIPTMVLFGASVNTLVMLGEVRPQGDDKFIYFNALQDSRAFDNPGEYCGAPVPLLAGVRLYGGLPIGLEISALRFLNATNSGDTTLDLALKSVFGQEWPEGFRRNFPGQNAVTRVAPLGSDPVRSDKGYFFLSSLLESEYPYRVEIATHEIWNTLPQPVIAGPNDFAIERGRRYTVIAYGSLAAGGTDAVTLFDRTPEPPPGSVGVRFFHAGFGALQGERYRIEIGGAQSPLMSYGQAPDPLSQSFVASASNAVTIRVLEEDGDLLHAQSNVVLEAGKTYIVVLSWGSRGDELQVNAIDEDVVD